MAYSLMFICELIRQMTQLQQLLEQPMRQQCNHANCTYGITGASGWAAEEIIFLLMTSKPKPTHSY